MSETAVKEKKSFLDKFMKGVEKAANKLPSPPTLFVCLFLITAVASMILSLMGVSAIHPSTGEPIVINNFFSMDGLNWILKNLVKNFTGYAPFGLVLTMTLGIGLCEQVGMVKALLRKCMRGVPAAIVPYVVALIGVCGNIASDSASVIIPPLAGLAFLGVGRNPILGMICGFSGTSAGFSANLMIAGTDALLQGITNTVLTGFLGEGAFQVNVSCNYLFMIVSTFMLALVIGTVVNFLEKKMPACDSDMTVEADGDLTDLEKKGLRNCGLAALAYVAVLLVGIFTGVLRNPETGSLTTKSPFMQGLIPILFLLFVIVGMSYGFTVGYLKTERDVSKAMTQQMAGMATYVVFCFASAQFISLFNWTKIGTLIAVGGAALLKTLGFTGMPMIILFILIVTTVNIIMGSGSAKWSIFAPIFVPMFMLLGYHPAFVQLAYRIGDSSTNIISPMSAYLFMMLGIAQQKYKKDATLGLFLSNLVPISLSVLFSWIVMLVIWNLLGLPIGISGETMYLPAGIL